MSVVPGSDDRRSGADGGVLARRTRRTIPLFATALPAPLPAAPLAAFNNSTLSHDQSDAAAAATAAGALGAISADAVRGAAAAAAAAAAADIAGIAADAPLAAAAIASRFAWSCSPALAV